MRVKDETKRTDIVNYTIDLVYRRGIAGVKMAHIAKEVGLSTGTLYIYFKNKEDLIVSIYAELFIKQQELSVEQLQSDLPYQLKLKKIWLQWMQFSVNNYKERHFMNQVKTSPYLKKIKAQLNNQKGDHLIDLVFKEGKTQGLIKDMDNMLLARIMKAVLNETAAMVLEKELKLNDDDMNKVFNIVWDAIKN